MNIKCSELDNMNITLDYFNLIKQISEELVKYLKGYRQIIQDNVKKIQSLHNNFKKKLVNPDNSKISQISRSLTSKVIQLLDQNNELYQLSVDELEMRLKEFDNFIKQKTEAIKAIQKSSAELNKSLTNSYSEVNKSKTNYLNSLSKTEDAINKYYLDKEKLKKHEMGLEKKSLNENEYLLLKEQQKNQLNEMNNSIKLSQNLEKMYQNSISSSCKIHEIFVENYKEFNDKLKQISCELSEEIKTLIVSFMLSYKNSYRQPLSSIDLYINEFNLLQEGKEIDKIINQDLKNDNLLTKIFPTNYKLKSIAFLHESNFIKKDEQQAIKNNNNVLQRKNSISKLEDGFEEMEYICDESLVLTIKTIFDNFNLIDKDEFDFKEEENKNKIHNYILKIIANMNSYPYGRYGKNSDKNKNININLEDKRKELTSEEILEIRELLDKHPNRIIFLQKLSDYRAKGKFYLCPEDYALISNFLNIILDKVKRDMDYHSAEMVIILSATYFIEEEKSKKYLHKNVTENKLFKDKTFWEEFLVYSINKEIMKTMKRDQKMKENKANSDNKISKVVFSQLLTLIDNMFEFGVDAKVVREVIEPKIKYYRLDDALKITINDVINVKSEEMIKEAEKEKNNKKEKEKKVGENIKKENEIKKEEENSINKEEENNKKDEEDNKKDEEKNKKDEGNITREKEEEKENKKNENKDEKKDNLKKGQEQKQIIDENDKKKEENNNINNTKLEKDGWEVMNIEK